MSASQAPAFFDATPEDVLTRTPITSYHGEKSFYCRVCEKSMPCAFLVTGYRPATATTERIEWRYVEDQYNHTIKEDSS